MKVNCLLSGLIWLIGPLVLIIFWHKRTKAPFFPALIAIPVCFAVFFFAGVIRSDNTGGNAILYYIRNGLLYGVLEEGSKFLVFRFLLSEYATAKNAVTYSIGHGGFEALGAAFSCFELIGKGTASPYILPMNLWSFAQGALSCISLTVIIVYGIRKGRSRFTLPAAVALHAFSNATAGIFITPVAVGIRTVLTAGECFAAYRLEKNSSKVR